MGAVTVTIGVISDDGIPILVDEVMVRVFDVNDLFVTEGVTGVITPGVVDFLLDGDAIGVDYIIRLAKTDWSFPPANKFEVAVLDPPGPGANTFQFTGHQGMTNTLVVIAINDDQETPQPVEDAQVRLFNSLDLFEAEGITSLQGEAEFVLEGEEDPGKTYFVRLHKSGVSFIGGPTQRIVVLEPLGVLETNVFDFTAHLIMVPESADEDLCLLSGYFVNPSLQPIRGLNIRFHPIEEFPSAPVMPYLSNPTIVRNLVIASDIIAQTNSSGYVSVALPRNSTFQVTIHGHESLGPVPLSNVAIPDAAGIGIHEVLFPYVKSVGYDIDEVTVASGSEAEVALSIIRSDLQAITEHAGISSHLVFESVDKAVAMVSITPEGALSVKGIAAGTTTVTVSRVAGTYAPRRPPVPDLVVTPSTLNVVVT